MSSSQVSGLNPNVLSVSPPIADPPNRVFAPATVSGYGDHLPRAEPVAAHHPRDPRRAAIAHLGQDAPTLLPLRAGDVLVVNASRAAVRAHATSPVALAHYVDAGVRVLSSPNLHANVIATDRRAVIGSANASHSSTLADEAAVITDDPEVVAAVRAFIDDIEEITEVDQTFLDNATAKAHTFARTCARWRLNCHGFGSRAKSTWSER